MGEPRRAIGYVRAGVTSALAVLGVAAAFVALVLAVAIPLSLLGLPAPLVVVVALLAAAGFIGGVVAHWVTAPLL